MEFVMFSPLVYPAGFCLNTDIENRASNFSHFSHFRHFSSL